jgi:hypothetical protein
MALDKLVDSTQLDTDLASVANAIRVKGGTSAQLAFPTGFVNAVNAIGGGGGSAENLNVRIQNGKSTPLSLRVPVYDTENMMIWTNSISITAGNTVLREILKQGNAFCISGATTLKVNNVTYNEENVEFSSFGSSSKNYVISLPDNYSNSYPFVIT